MKRLLIPGLAVILACATGCSSSSGSVFPPGIAAGFTASGTAATADMVRLTGSSAGDTVTIRMVIGGPTTSSDLYAFAFDVVVGDPDILEYVNGSATMGGALTTTGGQTSQVLAVQDGDRITFGVTKLGGGTGNGITAGEEVVLTVNLRVLSAGSTTLTLAGSPPNPAAALDSSGTIIGSVAFDTAAATITGN